MDNVEDMKEELKEIAEFLNNGCFSGSVTDKQRNLIIELTVMKLKAMAIR
mgnify:CR=1 FL=1